MQITAIQVRDFKRIREIKIEPTADKVLLLLGGANAQGKTSLLDALTTAFGGKAAAPTDPVRHGADDAEIRVELRGEGATLLIRRTLEPDGSSKLEVRDELGAVKSPQAVLDKIVGSRFLDPLAFLQLKPGDQRAALLKIVDADGKIAELDGRRGRVFDRRTEVGRDVKRLSAQLAGMPAVDPAAPIDVAALAAELAQISTELAEVTNRQRAAKAAEDAEDRAAERSIRAAKALADAEAEHAAARRAHESAKETAAAAQAAAKAAAEVAGTAPARRDELKAKILQADDHNATIAKLKAAEQRRVELANEVNKHELEHDKLDEQIKAIDHLKATALAAAALPVPGLGVTADAITLDGVPLAQASGAERHRVALALAIAASPNLRDVWIRDGALLDDDSLAAVAAHAHAAGVRVWVERVGTRDPGVIVIHDGRIREAAPTTAQRDLFA